MIADLGEEQCPHPPMAPPLGSGHTAWRPGKYLRKLLTPTSEGSNNNTNRIINIRPSSVRAGGQIMSDSEICAQALDDSESADELLFYPAALLDEQENDGKHNRASPCNEYYIPTNYKRTRPVYKTSISGSLPIRASTNTTNDQLAILSRELDLIRKSRLDNERYPSSHTHQTGEDSYSDSDSQTGGDDSDSERGDELLFYPGERSDDLEDWNRNSSGTEHHIPTDYATDNTTNDQLVSLPPRKEDLTSTSLSSKIPTSTSKGRQVLMAALVSRDLCCFPQEGNTFSSDGQLCSTQSPIEKEGKHQHQDRQALSIPELSSAMHDISLDPPEAVARDSTKSSTFPSSILIPPSSTTPNDGNLTTHQRIWNQPSNVPFSLSSDILKHAITARSIERRGATTSKSKSAEMAEAVSRDLCRERQTSVHPLAHTQCPTLTQPTSVAAAAAAAAAACPVTMQSSIPPNSSLGTTSRSITISTPTTSTTNNTIRFPLLGQSSTASWLFARKRDIPTRNASMADKVSRDLCQRRLLSTPQNEESTGDEQPNQWSGKMDHPYPFVQDSGSSCSDDCQTDNEDTPTSPCSFLNPQQAP